MGVADNFFILLGDTVHCVDDHQNNIGTVNGTKGTDDTVLFNQFFNFAFAAHTGRINKQVTLPVFYYRGINCVTGSTRLVADNGAFFPHQRVKDGRFSYVRPADQGDLDFILVFII